MFPDLEEVEALEFVLDLARGEEMPESTDVTEDVLERRQRNCPDCSTESGQSGFDGRLPTTSLVGQTGPPPSRCLDSLVDSVSNPSLDSLTGPLPTISG